MKTASISQLKNGLSAYVDLVRAGDTVLVTDRGVVVARLEPAGARTDPSGRLERLERAGLLRIGRGAPPIALLDTPAPDLRGGRSIVETVLEERRSGW
jgi:prevent-host-death family protein